MGDMYKCLRELFLIAERDPKLARMIYKSMPKGSLSLTLLNNYLGSKDNNVFNLFAEIILDEFSSKAALKTLLLLQRSNDEYIRNRARLVVLKLPSTQLVVSRIVKLFEEADLEPAHDVIRELMIKKFGKNMGWRKLIEIQRSNDADIRHQARSMIISETKQNFVYQGLIDFSSDNNLYVSMVARELLLIHYSDVLKMETLIEFQRSPNEYIQVSSRRSALLLPESKLNYTRLLSLSVDKCNEVKILAIELIAKNFSHYMSGKEILALQSLKSIPVRIRGKELALTLTADRFGENDLRRGLSSSSKYIREISSELFAKFYPSIETSNNIKRFALKYEFAS